MRPSRVWRPTVCVLLAAVVASCSSGSGGGGSPNPGPATPPPSGAALPAPSGEPAGPAVPATTAPFAQLTPGVVSTDADGVQQVLITGVDRFFQPGVFHMHPGTVRVILRNDDPVNVHNLIFPDTGGRTKDTLPGQANSVTVVLTKPGLYDFICSYHELVGMRGQVKVE